MPSLRINRHTTWTWLAGALAPLIGLMLALVWTVPAAARPAPTTAATKASAKTAAISYSQIKISVWPEYDDPRVLVIMEPVLAGSVKLPAKVTFMVPKGASVNMACEITESGAHSCRPLQVASNGRYDRVSFLVTSRRTLFFEYYYDAFGGGSAPDKKFTFNYVPTHGVGSLSIDVQRPLKATNFALDPPPQRTASDQKDFTYYRYNYTSIPQDKPISVSVAYTKTDPNPSVRKAAGPGDGVSDQQVQSQREVGSDRSDRGSAAAGWGSAIGILGVAALVGTLMYWMLLGNQRPPATTERTQGRDDKIANARATARRPGDGGGEGTGRGSSKGGGEGSSTPKEGVGISCSACGAQLEASARFCGSCGACQALVCSECGAECDRGNQFCSGCGAELAIGNMRDVGLPGGEPAGTNDEEGIG